MLDRRPQTRIMPLASEGFASPSHRQGATPEGAQYVGNGPSGQQGGRGGLQREAGKAAASYAIVGRRSQPGAILADSVYGRGTRLPLNEAGYYDWKRGMTVGEVVRRWQAGWEKVYDRSMPAMVPVKVLWPLREYTWTRETARDGGEYWDNLKASLKRRGWNPDEPLHLDIGQPGGVKVGEGNHRLAIARAAGVREVPVWFHFISHEVVKQPQHSLARSMPKPEPPPKPAPKPLPPDPERDKYVDDIMRLLSPGYQPEERTRKKPRGVPVGGLVEADVRLRELERAATSGDLDAVRRLARERARVGMRWSERDIRPGLRIVDLRPKKQTLGGPQILPAWSWPGDVWRVRHVELRWRDVEWEEPEGRRVRVAGPDTMLEPLTTQRIGYVWYKPADLVRALNQGRFGGA